MSYTDWIREMAELPKTAEFCLTDVTERVSAGDKVYSFLITEALGDDINPEGRRGQTRKVCRPRIYISSEGDVPAAIEITEPTDLEKKFIAAYSRSLHDFYILQSRLCDSVLASLTAKIAVVSESSAAILTGQLGDEVVKLVTKRLSGEEIGDSSLKTLLISQLTARMEKEIARSIRRVALRNLALKQLTYDDGDLTWEFTREDNGFELEMTWKDLRAMFKPDGCEVLTPALEVNVRDMFLFIVNMPSFGEMIAGKLALVTK